MNSVRLPIEVREKDVSREKFTFVLFPTECFIQCIELLQKKCQRTNHKSETSYAGDVR